MGLIEFTIKVWKLNIFYLDKSAHDNCTRLATITESFCQLEGHTSRVMHLCWNPHTDGILASASFDCTVQVWDVKHHLAVRNYRGHLGHVLCVQWSLLDKDIIYSGSDDHTLHGWKISEQIYTAPISGDAFSVLKSDLIKMYEWPMGLPKVYFQKYRALLI